MAINRIENIEPLKAIWIEALLQDRFARVFDIIGKVRKDEASKEIDLVCKNFYEDFEAIKIKDRNLANAKRASRNAKIYASMLGINKIMITHNSDSNEKNYISNCNLTKLIESLVIKKEVNTLNNLPFRTPKSFIDLANSVLTNE